MRNAYRSIIGGDLFKEEFEAEAREIQVEPSSAVAGAMFVSLYRPGGEQLGHLYLTDDEVTELIEALTYWRDK